VSLVQRTLDAGFDLDAFLARPLVARVAAAGPTVRPVWFLWEDEAFWWLTGGWSQLPAVLAADPGVALVVDTCDLTTGEVLQVTAQGTAEVVPFDPDRARRKLTRYLGADEAVWDERLRAGTFEDPSVRFVRLAPRTLRARDLSFRAPR
jgi:nitroimidazol reductase NimA-like FMN-containing flavoprotein (pyridoxamine 5'-phosphate oxidase superfamily)